MDSINQVRHAYVVTDLATDDNSLFSKGVGSVYPTADSKKETLLFKYKNPAGVTHSDAIDVKKILYTKVTKFEDLAYKLKRVKATLDTSVSANPVTGEEYILKVFLKQYIGLGEEDTMQKFGYYKVKPNDSASNVLRGVALYLFSNAEHDTTPVFNIYLTTPAGGTEDAPVAAGEVKVTSSKESDYNATYDGIIIEECEQYWKLGKFPQAVIPFDVVSGLITISGAEYPAFTIAKAPVKNTIPDGHNMADLEYFCVGARGDMYRGMGYPYNLDTTYVADPNATYDTIDIHYYFDDSNEGVQKSEKDLTLIVKSGDHNLTNSVVDAINAATGLTIEKIAVAGD